MTLPTQSLTGGTRPRQLPRSFDRVKNCRCGKAHGGWRAVSDGRRRFRVPAGWCGDSLERAHQGDASGGGAALVWSPECGRWRGTAAVETETRCGGDVGH